MEFKKYSEIENVTRTKEINNIIDQGKSAGEWICMEKVHGANQSFWYDGEILGTASRTLFLDKMDVKTGEIVFADENSKSFYNYERVRDAHVERIKKVWDKVHSVYNTKQISIYGELFGGTYPHPDVKKTKDATIIQKGVFYSPANDFYAFDIKVDENILDYYAFEKVCQDAGLFYAKVIFKGTFDECIKYSNEFQSLIPQWLGLPDIPNNVCEGIVIKPVIPSFFRNGSRVILKSKNEKFSEKKSMKDKTEKEPLNLSDAALREMYEVQIMITENRLRNVLSKIGQVQDSQFGMLMGAMSKDIMEEYMKDGKNAFESLDKKEQKHITKSMSTSVANLIRQNFINIIDEIF